MNTTTRTASATAPALAALALTLTACGVNTASTAPLEGGNAAFGTVVRDPGLWSDVRVIGANETFTNNLLTVQANIRNTGINTRRFEYKFDFYTDAGIEVGRSTTTRWRRATIRPGETRSLAQTAGSQQATRWNLQIRKQVDPAD